MAQQTKGNRRPRPGAGGPLRRKSCYFCREKIDEVDYKNYNQLRRYVSEKGKIRSRRITGRMPAASGAGCDGGEARERDGAPALRHGLGLVDGCDPPH